MYKTHWNIHVLCPRISQHWTECYECFLPFVQVTSTTTGGFDSSNTSVQEKDFYVCLALCLLEHVYALMPEMPLHHSWCGQRSLHCNSCRYTVVAESGVWYNELNFSNLFILHLKFIDRKAGFFNNNESKFWKQSVWILVEVTTNFGFWCFYLVLCK